MTIQEAIQQTVKKFPFQGYMTPANENAKYSYQTIGSTVLKYLKPGSSILDYGCGPCDNLAILQLLGYKGYGYDDLLDYWHTLDGNREKIFSFAADCGINFNLISEGPLKVEKNSFDMVMLHDVLEHLHNSPRDLLNYLLDLSTPEGLLFITVPNAVNIRKRLSVIFGETNLPPFESYYWYPGSWRGHVREYVKSDLVSLAKYLNLEILELRGCDHMLQKLPKLARPLYHLATSFFPSWKDSWLLVARKMPNWSLNKTLSQHEMAQILNKSTTFRYSE